MENFVLASLPVVAMEDESALKTYISWTLYIIALASAAFSIHFSIRSRRTKDERESGLMAARMNISMGLMLITIALIQIALFDNSTVRIIVGSVFLLLGFFNLFAGIRNHSLFSRR